MVGCLIFFLEVFLPLLKRHSHVNFEVQLAPGECSNICEKYIEWGVTSKKGCDM